MTGRVVLVTGATAGIGAVTARELARRGAHVIGVGRNAVKGAALVEGWRQETGNPNITFLAADLAEQDQVRALAEEVRRRHDRLDVLVNNAGGYFARRQENAEGREQTWALNHLSYFLLTHALLEQLLASAPARIVNVSSDAHQGGRLNFADLEGRRRYDGFAAYGQSKLANVLFTYELARRLRGRGVTANALHPGFVATNFGLNNGGVLAAGLRLIQRWFARTPEQGAATSIYLASAPEVADVTGQYFVDSRPARSAAATYDEALARRLWEVSEAMTAPAGGR